MEKQEEKDIELRCEEVQEILTRPPHALVRWGITAFFSVLALFFIGGCFFKYPDVVSAQITVTTEHPPVWIVARGSGKIKEVYGKDRERIEAGKIIAVLENPAETEDVLLLEEALQDFCLTDSCVHGILFPEHLALGSIQAVYATFIKSLTDYRNFLSLDLYEQKIEATRKELQEYRNYIVHLKRQAELDKEQVRIAETVHSREKKLFGEGLTAQSDYEEAKQVFLNRQQGQEQMMTSLSSAKIQEAQLQQNILEIRMERSREANSLGTALKAVYNELQVSIEDWKMTYLFISPAGGILSYNNVWQKNQNVNSGDKVFSIVASQTGDIIGKIKLPVNGSGKVKSGQRVNISVTGYPYMEFGFLTGTVVSVSLLTDSDSMYTVTVSLPQDLCTSYGKVLDFNGELTGTAEVMTDERSITGRLLEPLRYLWEKYL
ncbi:HlyD family secretion protein [Bacteroides intestinalis]|jgi:multidrug resistance efflux pump|uniref:HlyD family efflux transporter periplasmic adaptor subunit n=1 Tax=Bacteroides intestinalis TaxID=329854 RepID=A0A3E4KV40_9BACE|nr:HlyD family efflux transporter periplasmic adaptor subunit [Bacteroides intestinalis]QDO68349.1 HlyD family efflux transporter periplasmic adaptor subunit [Bacteroides intestinalis]RGK24328.1 HlyD family efflux transporter periplasmic adaptor subunit [Bacteroides intestinalis]RGT50109.1 HlyD family efflux transporter periplasmic adaptor subunit [Bacteroides intestinalis]RGX88010.1 HlyD family efflux transporter periplasmic adaptor subunit [Bacteroides intestinalis]RHN01142.1 HlyD family eff